MPFVPSLLFREEGRWREGDEEGPLRSPVGFDGEVNGPIGADVSVITPIELLLRNSSRSVFAVTLREGGSSDVEDVVYIVAGDVEHLVIWVRAASRRRGSKRVHDMIFHVFVDALLLPSVHLSVDRRSAPAVSC